jgi:hypothetical protein
MRKIVLEGWVAYNMGEPEIDNMTFFKTYKEAAKAFMRTQEIEPVEVIISVRETRAIGSKVVEMERRVCRGRN